MAENNSNKEIKLLPLFINERGISIQQFVEKQHIYVLDDNGDVKNAEDTAKQLFKDNRKQIFEAMSEEDKIRYGYWKYLKNTQGTSAPYPSLTEIESDDCMDNAEKVESADDINDEDYEMVLPYPCVLYIDSHCITIELMVTQTNFQKQEDDYYAFANEKLVEIIEDDILQANYLERRNPQVTVFCWSKAQNTHRCDTFQLSGGGEENGQRYVDSSWIDLSDFVMSLNTNTGNDAGAFSLSLPMYSGGIEFKKVSDIIEGQEVNSSLSILSSERQNQHFSVREEFNKDDSNCIFNQLISSNDIIFISFSDLKSNIEDDNQKIQHMFDSENISTLASESSFDMIALIDNVSIVKNSQSSDAHIEITGRDLTKLLIDDGSFFFVESTCNKPSEVFFNEQGTGRQGDVRNQYSRNPDNAIEDAIQRFGVRTAIDGQLDIFIDLRKQCLSYILKGAISQLANIEIVPSDVFVKWDDRTKWKTIHPIEELEDMREGKKTNKENNNTQETDVNAGKTIPKINTLGIEGM